MVKAIAAVAKSLDLTCLSEGIETAGQLDLLRRLDVEMGQGLPLARPLEADDWMAGVASGALALSGPA